MILRRSMSLLLGTALLILAALPVVAATPVRASDVAAPGGRLIVLWREDAPARIGIAGIDHVAAAATSQRSLVVAETGQAGAVARALRADPRVLAVVPDALVRASDWPAGPPDDPQFGAQTDLAQIHVPEVWPTTTGAPGVVVAVIDTGVDLSHPDLAGVAFVAARNEITDSTNISDDNGHGTHVAGTIFARTDNATGIAGIAPTSTLMPIKVLEADGTGDFADVLDGVDWARTHGADIINLSLGGSLAPEQVAFMQPTFTVARAAGILVVAAAGNTGSSAMSYPAALDGVVSVAAVDGSDAIAGFSTFNSAVDISAPGVRTLSTTAGGGYAPWSGTSMASPHVAGGAALVWSALPGLTVAALETSLRTYSVDLGAPGRDDHFGSGRLDVKAVLAATMRDATRPTITSRIPARGATGVFLRASVRIWFSERVKGISSTTLRLKNVRTGLWVPATVSYSAATRTATIDPTGSMLRNERYTVYVLAGIRDVGGNKLAPSGWSFRTRP